MNICLREIDKSNWFECTKLSVSEEQKKIFPVSALHWLAVAKYEYDNELELLAVYHDKEIIGMVGHAFDRDTGCPWIITVMIDYKYQGRGFGKQAVQHLVKLLAERYRSPGIMVGHRPENVVASNLYHLLGFREIDQRDGEIIRCKYL